MWVPEGNSQVSEPDCSSVRRPQITREPYMPHSEYQPSANANHPAHPGQTEFVYGLGETKGPLMKTGKRYIIEGRDSLGYDSEESEYYLRSAYGSCMLKTSSCPRHSGSTLQSKPPVLLFRYLAGKVSN